MGTFKKIDNDKVVLISSEPSGSISRYTDEQMRKVQRSSEKVLKKLAEIKTLREQ